MNRHIMSRTLILGLLASCVVRSAVGYAQAAPSSPPSPAASTSAQPTITDDVEVVAKNKVGAEIFAIGTPRFQTISSGGSSDFAYRSRAGRIVLNDAKLITIWDSTSGVVLQRILPRVSVSPLVYVSMAVSDDAAWLATDADNGVRLFRSPFVSPNGALSCYTAITISHNGGLLACGTSKIAVWDVAKRRIRPTTTI